MKMSFVHSSIVFHDFDYDTYPLYSLFSFFYIPPFFIIVVIGDDVRLLSLICLFLFLVFLMTATGDDARHFGLIFYTRFSLYLYHRYHHISSSIFITH